ncbi:Serine esterase family protein [Taphrina deformans PYCC 5710]|uniref:Serine esterase family protein n=1 Tax=Taphrina deformans (strain PYCC 5710 / ATCC 11124 / CBS 356.35 / IMI 108563 / JCM 9778 / NBRC 8474) TaxID=1097556 RepID=R4X7F7_TAPDE|nr:Serine esterase family protein [Taphrina deformans PYCC 5710]|eukprot:CCG81289.1 Serine esterase family protein [Taphrina deformans PYCC 5710]
MYHFKGALTVGQVNRFTIVVDPDVLPGVLGVDTLAVRVKNTTSALMRPAYLTGPYILYTSVKEQSYQHDTPIGKGDFPPHFDANVKTNCSRWQHIPIVAPPDRKLNKRTFVVEITSQSIFSPSATTYFEMSIGSDKQAVRSAARSGKPIDASTSGFQVSMQDTSTIWDMPPYRRDHPGHHHSSRLPPAASNEVKLDSHGQPYDHLVVLTHGIHSNLTSDMLFMKDEIEKTASKNGERVICKGFAGNACNTERGVKWLAGNVAEWVLRETGWTSEGHEATRGPNPYKKISFIAHSLGGLVQIYALGYLHDKTHGRIFSDEPSGLRPINFITLATPWLGISAENPAYVKLALDFGFVGKTGQDLGLAIKPLGEYQVHDPRNSGKLEHLLGSTATIRSRDPLLKLLSGKSTPSHKAIRLFQSRTVYANIENDGIVPLRTSSLYFLDWEGFSAEKAKMLKRLEENHEFSAENKGKNEMHNYNHGGDGVTSKQESDGSQLDNDSHDSNSYSSSDESDATVNEHNLSAQDRSRASTKNSVAQMYNEPAEPQLAAPKSSVEINDKQILGKQSSSPAARDTPQPSPGSRIRSVAHALNFAGMIRRISGTHDKLASAQLDEGSEAGKHTDQSSLESNTDSIEGSSGNHKVMASGPSNETEDASHTNGGLLGLIKPSQTHRKPSRAFTRSQTVAKHDENADNEQVNPEEPSRTSFFRALESVLHPPMPALDYITDPGRREPLETIIVHDKFYHPDDIPPLRELPRRSTVKNQSHHEKKAEDRERTTLEKVKLEEEIARAWHEDMIWRKVLVRLKPDAHNNISKSTGQQKPLFSDCI